MDKIEGWSLLKILSKLLKNTEPEQFILALVFCIWKKHLTMRSAAIVEDIVSCVIKMSAKIQEIFERDIITFLKNEVDKRSVGVSQNHVISMWSVLVHSQQFNIFFYWKCF